MRIICPDLNYGEANSPGAPMAFQEKLWARPGVLLLHWLLIVPGRSHYVWMPFMVAEENAREKSIVPGCGAERVKQAQLFPPIPFMALRCTH